MKPTLLVMAAGMGSRYGGLKQLDGFGPKGETLLHFAVFDAIRAGFGKVVFVIRPEMEEAFRSEVCTPFQGKIQVDFAMQTPEAFSGGFRNADRSKPWGTGQAVLVARDVVHEPFAVINADDFYGHDAMQKMGRFLATQSNDYAMVAYTLRHTLSPHGHVSRGVCEVDAAGFLSSVTEHLRIERDGDNARSYDPAGIALPLLGDTPVSMNLWGFQPSFFDVLQRRFHEFLAEMGHEAKTEFVLPAVVDGQISDGSARVKVLRTEAHWLGVTYTSDRETVEQGLAAAVASGDYPNGLWGV